MRYALLTLLGLWLGLLVGCSDVHDFGATPEEHYSQITAGVEHKWGDPPLPAAMADEGWIKQDFPAWPTDGPKDAVNLWQRVKIPELPNEDQTLLLLGAWRVFEVYLDGERIYHFGTIGPNGRGVFFGQSWHWLDLPKSASGKWLYFRFFSDDGYIGLYDSMHLGTRADHVIWMFKRDIAMIVMGAIYIFLGIITIFMFSRNRTELVNVSFGCFAISMGIYELCRTYMKQFLLHDPLAWGTMELTALYLTPMFFLWFTEHLLGQGPIRVVRRLWQMNIAFTVFAYARMISGGSLWDSLYMFQCFFLIEAVIITAIIGRAAVTGDNMEARFFFGGVSIVVLGAVHDVLASLGLFKGIGLINHIGMFFLISSLALIVGRRYFLTIAIRKNLELASAVQNLLLPKKPSGAFGPFEYASLYEPHGRMSGDWMNFWVSGNGERRLMFGDVIGKGPRAALAVAAIAAFVENAKEADEGVEACIRRINSGLMKLFGTYITSTLSAVELRADGSLVLYNCGGIGWIKLGARAEHISMPSSVLGFDDDLTICKRNLVLAPGEYAFAFTDGVLEGTRSLVRLVRAFKAKPAHERSFADVFATAVECGAATAHADDRSIVAVRRPA